VAWFGVAEAQFALRGVDSQCARFGLITAVIPERPAREVRHILVNLLADCHDKLKVALLSNQQLTEIQKSELLFNMDTLGPRRPIHLLAEMLEPVKPGEESTQLSEILFICRLPSSVHASCLRITILICAPYQKRRIASSPCWPSRSTISTPSPPPH